jgi:histidine triad (HIT) family protein
MKDCVFCLQNNQLKVPIVHESERWVVLDMYPLEGSSAVLAVTKRHIAAPFDIDPQEWAELHGLLPVCKSFLDERETPQGYNLGWNVGLVGGQTVPHAHLHIVSRFDDEALAGTGIRYHFKPDRNPRHKK